ncbi:hypothetical protein LMG31841_00460 [Paraburkholderia saeva]|uniref:Uncharacterized protein n=1 Tax=Paraburkholderia saeva TaxID=2777537 RepID=A0A9N8X0B9_9BURK|nr:hypothetical protein LMG31841_00460 [Paraburkholderia saeva]
MARTLFNLESRTMPLAVATANVSGQVSLTDDALHLPAHLYCSTSVAAAAIA